MVGILALIFVIGTSIVAFSSNEEKDQADTDVNLQIAELQPQDLYSAEPEELLQAASEIGKINNEKELLFRMMELSFQKVEYDNQGFKVPGTKVAKRLQMSKENIQYLYESMAEIQVSANYENILDRWARGNFNNIVNDHWDIRDAINPLPEDFNPPYRTTARTPEEELQYVEHFFGEEGLKKHNEQWN